MTDRFVTRGFVGRRDDGEAGAIGGDARRRRTPPGQYLTTEFPVRVDFAGATHLRPKA